jgi:hypothetical protein
MPIRPLSLCILSASLVACAPNPNDPPTPIEDPASELPAKGKKDAKSNAAEERRKKAQERREKAEKIAREKEELATTKAPAALGQPAPDFTLPDLDGGQVSLASFRGKTVVLEWFNPECPFVKYAHDEGPLKDQAKRTVSDEIVWISINSGAPGKQGHGIGKNKAGREHYMMSNPILIDEGGDVGRRYGAKTTPHMYVLDKEGKLVYRGAIDNAPMGKVKGEGEPVNYVDAALADLAAGRPVATPETKSYGCSVKYGA